MRCALSERRCTLSEWSFTFELVGGVCRLEASIRLRRVRRECPRQPDLSPAGRGGGQARATGGAAMLAAGACPRAGGGGEGGAAGPSFPPPPAGRQAACVLGSQRGVEAAGDVTAGATS